MVQYCMLVGLCCNPKQVAARLAMDGYKIFISSNGREKPKVMQTYCPCARESALLEILKLYLFLVTPEYTIIMRHYLHLRIRLIHPVLPPRKDLLAR